MTVTSSEVKKTYSGNDITVAFSFPIYFLQDEDLVVQIEDADGAVTTQTLTTDYTVSGAGVQAGGTVTMNTAPATGETLIIFRAPSDVQETDFQDFDIDPASAKENAFDLRTMISQRQAEMLGRAWILKESSTFSNLTVPDPESNKYLGWNSAGDAMVNKEVVATGTIGIPVPINQGGTGGTTSNAALTALGGTSLGLDLFRAESESGVLDDLSFTAIGKAVASAASAAAARSIFGLGTSSTYDVGSNAGEVMTWATGDKYPIGDGSNITNVGGDGNTYVVTQTWTDSTTTNLAITGVGFRPTAVSLCLMPTDNYSVVSTGMSDGTYTGCTATAGPANLGYATRTGGAGSRVNLSSFDSNGATFTRASVGGATGGGIAGIFTFYRNT